MKKEDLPQDESDLAKATREVCYVKGSEGKYQTELSTGWDVKIVALDNAWEEINDVVADAKEAFLDGKKSPIFYYMHLNLMDISILAGYTGFMKCSIKRHFNPGKFKKLSKTKLLKYAEAFNISVDELVNPQL